MVADGFDLGVGLNVPGPRGYPGAQRFFSINSSLHNQNKFCIRTLPDAEALPSEANTLSCCYITSSEQRPSVTLKHPTCIFAKSVILEPKNTT